MSAQPGGNVVRDHEAAEYERWVEEASFALTTYHRTKHTDSRQQYARALAEKARATANISKLVDRGISVYFQVGASPITCYDIHRNAYDMYELTSRQSLEPGEVVEIHFHHAFGFGEESTVIFGWLDYVSVNDMASSLCEGGRLSLTDPRTSDQTEVTTEVAPDQSQ